VKNLVLSQKNSGTLTERVFLNPLFLGLLFSIIIIILLPPLFNKYVADLVGKEYKYESRVNFHDLDNDSYSEQLWLHYSGNNGPNSEAYNAPALIVFTDCSVIKENKVSDQFNLQKKWFMNQNMSFGDFDQDNFDEVYLFTFSNDSLFLLGLDPMVRKRIFFEKFITKFNYLEESPDIRIGFRVLFFDLNNDGYKEVIFDINAGLTISPRSVFAYDIRSDTITKSRTSYARFKLGQIIQDNVLGPLMCGHSYASENLKDLSFNNTFLSDSSSWLIVLDNKLEPFIDPVKNFGYTSAISAYFKKENDQNFLYSLFRAPRGRGNSRIVKYNLSGDEICRLELPDSVKYGLIHNKNITNSDIFLVNHNDKTFTLLSEQLKPKRSWKIKFDDFFQFDIDEDGTEEIITIIRGSGTAIIYRDEFLYPTPIKTAESWGNYIITPCQLKDKSANFMVHAGDFSYYFKYYRNPLFYLKYIIYIGIYLIISFLIYIIMNFQKKALLKKYEQQQRMTELELLTIKNQIDPHFTFNAINTASSAIFEKDKETAYQFMVDFSSLIRNTLKNSKEIAIALKEELDFVENYLKLQQFRHEFSFQYRIDIHGDIDQDLPIPKMIIQTFVENAIKHGLVHKKTRGELEVRISKINNSLVITIADNGIGRKKATEIESKRNYSTGKGYDIIKQIIGMYNKLHNSNVTFKTVDLYKDGVSEGTKIEINIPYNL